MGVRAILEFLGVRHGVPSFLALPPMLSLPDYRPGKLAVSFRHGTPVTGGPSLDQLQVERHGPSKALADRHGGSTDVGQSPVDRFTPAGLGAVTVRAVVTGRRNPVRDCLTTMGTLLIGSSPHLPIACTCHFRTSLLTDLPENWVGVLPRSKYVGQEALCAAGW